MRFARVRIGIGDVSVLPVHHNITHRAPNGFVTTAHIEFEVETNETESVQAWRERLNGRPFPNGTPFGVVPTHNPPHAIETPLTIPVPRLDVPLNPQAMQIDPVVQLVAAEIPTSQPNPVSNSARRTATANTTPNSSSAPTPQLMSPFIQRRRGGITINEPASVVKPVVGVSPSKEKGKKTATACKTDDPLVNDYDSDEDSDENSFQNALNAIHNRARMPGSTSGVQHTPPHSSNAPSPHDSGSGVEDRSAPVTHPITPTVTILPPQTTPDSDSENDTIAAIAERLIDEESLLTRARRLQKKKASSSRHKPTKKVRFVSPSCRKAPSRSPMRKTPYPTKIQNTVLSRQNHTPRSLTKITYSSSHSPSQPTLPQPPPPHTPDVIEISDTSTEYTIADDPILAHEWRYNKAIPRRSFRFQVKNTHTPILKRAQKRKAAGSSQPAGTPLLCNFPYLRFTVEQIERLFRVYNIVLGKNSHDRALLIPAIQNMNRAQFEQLLASLDFHTNQSDKVICLQLDHVEQFTHADHQHICGESSFSL